MLVAEGNLAERKAGSTLMTLPSGTESSNLPKNTFGTQESSLLHPLGV